MRWGGFLHYGGFLSGCWTSAARSPGGWVCSRRATPAMRVLATSKGHAGPRGHWEVWGVRLFCFPPGEPAVCPVACVHSSLRPDTGPASRAAFPVTRKTKLGVAGGEPQAEVLSCPRREEGPSGQVSGEASPRRRWTGDREVTTARQCRRRGESEAGGLLSRALIFPRPHLPTEASAKGNCKNGCT